MRSTLGAAFAALAFFTRIPPPPWPGYAASFQRRAPVWGPAVGWLVGAIVALCFWAANQLLPPWVASVLAIGALVYLTRGLHEDGLADLCDGLGGGHTPEKVLVIMRDPCIGVFGCVALVLSLLLRVALLTGIGELLNGRPNGVMVLLFACIWAHSTSRWLCAAYMCTHAYLRPEGGSTGGSIANPLSKRDFVLATVLGGLPLAGLCAVLGPAALWLALSIAIVYLVFSRLLSRRLGGYTGDCLGAAQQLGEMAAMLGLLVLLSSNVPLAGAVV